MKQQAMSLAKRTLTKVAPDTADRLRIKAREKPHNDKGLRDRVEALEREIQELRQVNRRLSDALDVMTEILVPAMDRDDAKVKAALDRLGRGRQ
jgi:hypothetical protein